MAIFTTLLPILVRVIGYVLDKVDADKATRAAFAAFIDNAQRQNLVPLSLKQSYDDQLQRLRDQIAKDDLAKKAADSIPKA